MGELEVQGHCQPHSERKTSLVCLRPCLKRKKKKELEPEDEQEKSH